MVIYIEYAFLENFLFDGALLALALFATKTKIRWWRIALSACFGAVFAILFPLLRLPDFLGTVFKIAVGFLLSMLAFGRLKTKKEWGRYALTSIFFFCFAFGFGGTLLGVYGEFGQNLQRISSVAVFLGFALLSGGSVLLVRKLYARRAVFQSVYPCIVRSGTKRIQTQGFLDSGNLATKNNIPVCFASPEVLYELFGDEIISKGAGQVCDEMQIVTLGGEKTVPLYKGDLEVEGRKIQVYFAPSKNMINRDYKILLHSGVIGETYETH